MPAFAGMTKTEDTAELAPAASPPLLEGALAQAGHAEISKTGFTHMGLAHVPL